MNLRLYLIYFVLSFGASAVAQEPGLVTFQLRDYKGQLAAIKTTTPQPAMNNFTPTQLLQTLAATEKKGSWVSTGSAAFTDSIRTQLALPLFRTDRWTGSNASFALRLYEPETWLCCTWSPTDSYPPPA